MSPFCRQLQLQRPNHYLRNVFFNVVFFCILTMLYIMNQNLSLNTALPWVPDEGTAGLGTTLFRQKCQISLKSCGLTQFNELATSLFSWPSHFKNHPGALLLFLTTPTNLTSLSHFTYFISFQTKTFLNF